MPTLFPEENDPLKKLYREMMDQLGTANFKRKGPVTPFDILHPEESAGLDTRLRAIGMPDERAADMARGVVKDAILEGKTFGPYPWASDSPGIASLSGGNFASPELADEMYSVTAALRRKAEEQRVLGRLRGSLHDSLMNLDYPGGQGIVEGFAPGRGYPREFVGVGYPQSNVSAIRNATRDDYDLQRLLWPLNTALPHMRTNPFISDPEYAGILSEVRYPTEVMGEGGRMNPHVQAGRFADEAFRQEEAILRRMEDIRMPPDVLDYAKNIIRGLAK